MAIKIKNTKTSIDSVKVLVYGDAGTGKTRLCATVPKPIILSAEAGLLSLSQENIPVIDVKTVKDVIDSFQFLTESEEAKQFETICLDSISEIGEVFLNALKKKHTDARQAYGELSEDMTDLIRKFRDIPNKNVYFTAKSVKVEDDNGITSFRPGLPGKTLLNNLPFFFDEVFALKIGKLENGTEYNYLQTNKEMRYVAKDRSGCCNPIERPDLGYIFKKIKSGKIYVPEKVKIKEESEENKSDTSK